jgi:hypothetical protein
MAFKTTEVPSYSGQVSEGYEFGQKFRIPNGSINLEVSIGMPLNASIYWSRRYESSSSQNIVGRLNKFYGNNYKKFRQCTISVLDDLIKHYKGFLSPVYLTEKFWFCFDQGGFVSASENVSKDFKTIAVFFNVDYLNLSKFEIINLLKHELFHLIAELHEGQNNTIEAIDKLQNKLSSKINANSVIVCDGLNKLLDYCKKDQINHLITFEGFEKVLENFYERSANRFWNIVCDSALCVIAIELGDTSFIRWAIKKDLENISNLKKSLENIKKVRAYVIENELDEQRKNFLLASLNLIQFIVCLNNMPYDAIAYGVLGEDWRPKSKLNFIKNWWKSKHKNESSKNIDDFKNSVLHNCEPKVAEGFLRFYENYLHIIEAQAIHNNPFDPNITQQIHNIESIDRGKEAYVSLNREFFKLYKELEKYN